MKELSELVLPEDVRYTKDHEWGRLEGDVVRCGISDYAQDQLGDIVFVELPEVGERFEQGGQLGTVESVKAVAELYAPVAGEVVAVNGMLEDSPQLVNQDPYGQGWMIDVKPDDPAQLDTLMDAQAYRKMLEGLE
ncbi:MAG: glycine cleavage system protein GcvH [Deltaproteobacteria bacterium]|mgnify:CR=1 FL=1|nr:glycine cleavage system protein GcvH [Deltaproteobacteria bacterium]MBW1930661.1 glycine cleavage system protein GcvH [Deltaproteobacteria bacterium]MBW2023926.1 glycine cleavage system protein GcvH [Deltaproteobacteria bacterium]MBW2124317.1 glycine cleavage system protein GcvH [Deltaproteobacteria bacterium]RLB19377.1 MAG: glycine cleavage system protein GcvH [Deltaproteobacteria bacterium]